MAECPTANSASIGSMNHFNSYQSKPTYTDILHSKVTDDSNRLGLDTFQLIHSLNKAKHQG